MRYITQELHAMRNYTSCYFLTDKVSFESNHNNFFNDVLTEGQVIFYDPDEDSKKDCDLLESIFFTCSILHRHQGRRILLIVDDLSEHIDKGRLNFTKLLTKARHIGLDIMLSYHMAGTSNSRQFDKIRGQFSSIFVFGSNMVQKIAKREEWINQIFIKDAVKYMMKIMNDATNTGIVIIPSQMTDKIEEYVYSFKAGDHLPEEISNFPMVAGKKDKFIGKILIPKPKE